MAARALDETPAGENATLVWASHLQDLFSALAGLPLPQVARLLRDRLRDFRSWLRPLRTDESLDPEAAYLAALAWADTNQYLEGLWQGLALRRDREPAYYTDIGLLGLRKTRDERGHLPSKAPFLLLATLIDLADTGLSQKDWLLTTRALLGGYHYSLETWVREFEPVLEARQDAERGPEWLKKVLPQLRGSRQLQQHGVPSRKNLQPTTFTLHDCNWMVSEVKRVGPAALGERLEHYLNLQRAFANESRNPHFLVRTFSRLAEAGKLHDPKWAIARAEEALAWNPNDPYNWMALAHSLWSSGLSAQESGYPRIAQADCSEALNMLWDARLKFWWNQYVVLELAKLYRNASDYGTAEALYREAVNQFPNEYICRAGLSEVLGRQQRFDEAEEVLRNAVREIPNEAGPRNLLAFLLHRRERIDEAQEIYRETISLFPDDPTSRTGLAVILHYHSARSQNDNQREEARELFEEAARLGSKISRTWLAGFDLGWQRLVNGQSFTAPVDEELDESITLADQDYAEMRPAQRLGRALLLQWQARRAESSGERERLFAEAKALLTLPDELTGECRTAFVEARGFLLLARDRATEACAYFEQQVAAFTLPPLGLRLGFAEARARLGETLSDTEEAELASFGPEGSILPLVLKAVRLLQSTASDDVLCDLLLELYPRVRDLAGMPASELGDEDEPPEPTVPRRQQETPDTMMAQLLLASVFRPAAINSRDDLKAADSVSRVRAALKSHRDDIFSVAEKLALAC